MHVDAGAFSQRMIALLAKEVPDCTVVTSSGSATLRVAIMRSDEHLDVDMTAPPSTPVLARRVAIDEGDPEPALRRIALLCARAVESSASLEPFEIAREVEPTAERGWSLNAEASFVTEWWASPRLPQLGPAIALTLDLGELDFGAWAALFVPNQRTVDSLEVRATELSVVARGAWRPLSLGPVALGLELGGGINAIWLRARSVAFTMQTDDTVRNRVEGLVRGGVVLEAWLVGDRLHAFARGGGVLRLGALRVDLPDPVYPGAPIRTGVLGPWIEIGMAVRFF